MEYIVITFKSRASVVAFSEFLNSNGIKNDIINTPKEANVGCGLSIRVQKSAFLFVKRAIYVKGVKNFVGFFLVREVANRRIVKSI